MSSGNNTLGKNKDFSFEACLDFVFEMEGGFSNDAADRGGATNFGITHEEYYKWLKRKGLPHKDIRDITKQEASQIYKEQYWDAFDCGSTPEPLNLVLFDTAVQHGKARQLYKKALEQSPQYSNSTANIARTLIEVRRNYYYSLVKQSSSQGKFLKGWLNRMDALQKRAGV